MTDYTKYWDFGAKVGGALGKARQAHVYGKAFKEGGWEGVGEAAGQSGDLDTAASAQTQAVNEQNLGITQTKRKVEILGKAAMSLQGVPYEQRKARLQQMAPMVTGLGIDAQTINSFDPTDENLANILAQVGQYSNYSDYKNVDGVGLVGITPTGETHVLQEAKSKLAQVDAGDHVDLTDPTTGASVRRIEKGAAPRAHGSDDAQVSRLFSQGQQLADDFRQQVKP
ncbi:MAG: hypothetical protein AB7O04_15930, partial [Hyphomonadaceae bacterium]